MLHGRGATAEDIIGLARHLHVDDFAIVAPQATNYTWYPQSFLAPRQQNEPWLSSALALVGTIVSEIQDAGIKPEHIYFTGFSQGACLTLEFVAQQAQRWGGVAAFTGGLIGDTIDAKNYRGDFKGTPVFIGGSNPDPHVPAERIQASATILRSMHADVTAKIYPNMGHTIIQDEIDLVHKIIFLSPEK
jgi:phospholipase/carboxylesterase